MKCTAPNRQAPESRSAQRIGGKSSSCSCLLFVPHICEEMWENWDTVARKSISVWPSYDEAALKLDAVEIVTFQINLAEIKMKADVDSSLSGRNSNGSDAGG